MIPNNKTTTNGTEHPQNPLIPERNLPTWNKYLLRSQKKDSDLQYGSSVLMGHYLIFMVNEETQKKQTRKDKYGIIESYFVQESSTIIFVIDLHDNSVQEITTEEQLLSKKGDVLIKCNENQILILGGNQTDSDWIVLTIDSFDPFDWESKVIHEKGKRPVLEDFTSQIFKEVLYVYGRPTKKDRFVKEKNELWSLNLNDLTWKLHQTKETSGLPNRANSCIIQDNLYVYGGNQKDIFQCDLKDSMIWKKLEQEVNYFGDRKRFELSGGIYKDNLIILGDDHRYYSSENMMLDCWNANNNTWSNFEINKPGRYQWNTGLFVYKNTLMMIQKEDNGIFMTTLNLQKLPLNPPKEENANKSLFLREDQSDILFKVEDKIMPAHKSILTQKSRYFANLFKSGMVESRQEIIEMSDFEYHIFKEFLRFLYFDEVQLNENIAFKLLPLADKYIQSDLAERCLDFLIESLNSDNVYSILDYARNEEITGLENWCMRFLEDNINVKSVSEFISYVNKQENSKFYQENLLLRNKVIRFIIDNYAKISHEFKFYEDFLVKIVAFDTISQLASFVYGESYKDLLPEKGVCYDYPNLSETAKETFQRDVANLKETVVCFAHVNFEQLRENKMNGDFPTDFLLDLLSYKIGTQKKSSKKRGESGKKDNNEEDSSEEPTLKKTKK